MKKSKRSDKSNSKAKSSAAKKRTKTLKHIRKIYLTIMWIMFASLIVAAAYSLFFGNYLILFTSVIVGILLLIPYFFKWKYSLSIPMEIELVVLIFIYATLFLGEALSFYHHFWWWDLVLHTGSAIIFGFIGFIVLYFLYAHHQVESKAYAIALFSFSFAIAIGVVWEIFEFGMDTFFGLNMQKSGLIDTMGDLIVDTLGALLASGIGYFYLKVKHTLVFKDIVMRMVGR